MWSTETGQGGREAFLTLPDSIQITLQSSKSGNLIRSKILKERKKEKLAFFGFLLLFDFCLNKKLIIFFIFFRFNLYKDNSKRKSKSNNDLFLAVNEGKGSAQEKTDEDKNFSTQMSKNSL